MSEAQEQAGIQRAEAKRLLRSMFMIAPGESNGTVERIVDCIIGAAILKMTEILAQASATAREVGE